MSKRKEVHQNITACKMRSSRACWLVPLFFLDGAFYFTCDRCTKQLFESIDVPEIDMKEFYNIPAFYGSPLTIIQMSKDGKIHSSVIDFVMSHIL